MPLSAPSTWAALLLGAAFLAVGIVFAAAPELGAWIFGIETNHPVALAYVQAIAFRDLALALYIFGLVALGTRAALSTVLAGSLIIPACDLALVMSVSGTSAGGQILVHLAGAAALAAVSLWLRADLRPLSH